LGLRLRGAGEAVGDTNAESGELLLGLRGGLEVAGLDGKFEADEPERRPITQTGRQRG
jgi:hypothetical protein